MNNARSLERLHADFSTALSNFDQTIEQLEPEERECPGGSGPWSPKDVIAHLIGWDNALQKFIAAPSDFNPGPLYEIDRFNATSVATRQDRSWEDIIDEWRQSCNELHTSVTRVTVEMPIYARVCEWLQGRRDDYEHHTQQMERWLEGGRIG